MGATPGATVRAVYVILTHRDVAQVRRLTQAILASSPNARVLVAHDDRNERFPPTGWDARVDVFVHGLATDWGSWELVEATLSAFRQARQRHNPELVCLISGSDYPVRCLAEWEADAIGAESWIGAAAPLTYKPRWGRPLGEGNDRFTRYAYRWYRQPWAGRAEGPHWWPRIRHGLAHRLEPVFDVREVTRGRGTHYGIRRLRSPFSIERPAYVGSQWLAVRREELDRLLDVDLAPGSVLERAYRRSVIPDESAFVTPLSWHKPPSPLPRVTYICWDDIADQPLTWTIDDLDTLRASGSPFCRKVDSRASAELMDALDGLTVAPPGSIS